MQLIAILLSWATCRSSFAESQKPGAVVDVTSTSWHAWVRASASSKLRKRAFTTPLKRIAQLLLSHDPSAAFSSAAMGVCAPVERLALRYQQVFLAYGWLFHQPVRRRFLTGSRYPVMTDTETETIERLKERFQRRYPDITDTERLKKHYDNSCKILGKNHPTTIWNLNNYALNIRETTDAATAEPLQKQVLAEIRSALGPEHPNTLVALANYAETLSELGREHEAEAMKKVVCEVRRLKLGPRHPDTLQATHNYAHTLSKLGHLEEARPLMAEVLEHVRVVYGPKHENMMLALTHYIDLLGELGRYSEQATMQLELLGISSRKHGPKHEHTLMHLNNYAVTLSRLERFDEAAVLLSDTLRMVEAGLGEWHPKTLMTRTNYADSLSKAGHLEEASEIQQGLLRETMEAEEFGPGHPLAVKVLNSYADTLTKMGDVEKAEQLRKTLTPLFDASEEESPEVVTIEEPQPEKVLSMEEFVDEMQKEVDKIEQRQEGLGIDTSVVRWEDLKRPVWNTRMADMVDELMKRSCVLLVINPTSWQNVISQTKKGSMEDLARWLAEKNIDVPIRKDKRVFAVVKWLMQQGLSLERPSR